MSCNETVPRLFSTARLWNLGMKGKKTCYVISPITRPVNFRVIKHSTILFWRLCEKSNSNCSIEPCPLMLNKFFPAKEKIRIV